MMDEKPQARRFSGQGEKGYAGLTGSGGKKKEKKENRKEGKRPYLNKQTGRLENQRRTTRPHPWPGFVLEVLNEVKRAKPGQTVLFRLMSIAK